MAIKSACIRTLGQLSEVLEGIRNEDYTRPSHALGGATVGQHFRHTIEFFLCLEESLTSGIVNYDQRAHDPVVETDRSLASFHIARLKQFVQDVADRELTLASGYDLASDPSSMIPTNLFRELVYNVEHAIHHMALMKIGLREVASYISLPADFGVAASTIRWKQRVGAGVDAHRD